MSNKLFLFLLSFLILNSCTEDEKWDYAIIPLPDSINAHAGGSSISSIIFPSDSGAYRSAIEAIREMTVMDVNYEKGEQANIEIEINEGEGNDSEFSIDVQGGKIRIVANNEKSIKSAMGRLVQLQLLNDGSIPSLTLEDQPRFNYRGMHLDVGRHFFPAVDIKKYIDFLFLYGYNTFHWHLTEDQGWRIEIKKYPKLQEIAAYRDKTLIGHYNDQPHQYDNTRYGGYYTQDEVREIVQYAAEKGIQVIPEIELPGHSLAALAAYPELACENKEFKVGTKWGVFEDIYCPTETTFEFLQNVFDEVMVLFPSKYIHIGGDEAPKRAWEQSSFCQELIKKEGLVDEHGLQSYFIARIEKYLNDNGRQIIGWDEILEGGLAPNATVMSWRGISGGIEAAEMGHEVIMTPTSHCYFDYYQSDHPDEPLAIGGYLPVKKVYNYDPIPDELDESKRSLIIGAQGNVWSEYLKEFKDVEYMALSRMMALSEVLWVEPENKSYDHFTQSLARHTLKWTEKGVNIANHIYDISPLLNTENVNGTKISIIDLPQDAIVQIKEADGNSWSELKSSEYLMDKTGVFDFRAMAGDVKGRVCEIDYHHHLGTSASISFETPPVERYSGNGPGSVINGVKGSDEKYGDKEWLGFNGTNFNCEIQLSETEKISNITLRFFKGEGQWIYLPRKVDIHYSLDGENYQLLAEESKIEGSGKVIEVEPSFDQVEAKYLRVVAENYGLIPEGRQGAGHKAWLFVDEITIE